ncbi:MAG TPA: NAD-dependent epimerase/dehydratase family protein, partial [Polyangiaceae bacterium]|nr:NAD-dependent epimerase/dehydratase family protein [Polyangiaceae bacterium]
MKLLVTGGAGHLGANLIRRLLVDGADGGVSIRALARREEAQANTEAFAGLDVEVVYGDLRDLESLHAAVKGVDRIFHCAAQISTVDGQEQALFENNVVGT